MLDVSRLQAGYGRARVVHDFSLSVGPGEVLGLVGRNGVGKTTSLKAIQVAGSLSGGERKLLAFARMLNLNKI